MPPKSRLSAEERRVLEMLAGATNGCPEELLLANGFTFEILAGLVSDGRATARLQSVGAGRTVVIAITDVGRRALEW